MKKLSKKALFGVLAFVLILVVIGTSVFTNAQNSQKNIALRAAVYADTGDFYLENGVGPSSIHDNKTDTFFSTTETTAQNTTETVTMVLDGTYQVSSISLVPRGVTRNGLPVDFTLSVYNGSEWVEIDRKKDNAKTAETYTLNNLDVTCTAVRLSATKLSLVLGSSKYALQLAEFKIFGLKADNKLSAPIILKDTQNVAKGGEVIFDVPDWAQSSFPKQELTDGIVNTNNNFTTTNALTQNKKQEVYVTFKNISQIDEIELYPAVETKGDTLKYAGGFPASYTISVWNGNRWCEVASEKDFNMGSYGATANTVSAKKHKFAVVETNAIRLTVEKHSAVNAAGTQFALRLGEIIANGVKSSKTDFNSPAYSKDYIDVSLEKLDSLDNKSLIYTFNKSYAVTEVILGGKDISSFPKEFTVSLWNGNDWQTVDKRDSFDIIKNRLYIAVDKLDSRAIKLTADKELTALNITKGELLIHANNTSKVVKPVNPVVNAANGAAVKTDTPSWAQKDYSAANLVNGSVTDMATTTYSTASSDVKTVMLTLNGAYDIDTVNLYPRIKNKVAMPDGGYPVSFNIKAWNGTAWETVKTVKNESLPQGEYPVAVYKLDKTILCNAVIIEVTTLGASDNKNQPYVLQLAEIELLGKKSTLTVAPPKTDEDDNQGGNNNPSKPSGENAALNGTASMEIPSWAVSFPSKNLVDGSYAENSFSTTEYTSDQKKNESASVVFKNGAYNIKTVMLYPRVKGGAYGGGFPVDFKVSAWNGTKWVSVYSKTGLVKNDNKPFSIEITPTICNAIKIEATKLGESETKGKYCLQLTEIEAYGEKSDKNLALPTQSGSGSNSGSNTNSVTLNNDGNLALNKPIKASSDLAQYNAPATKANDGSVGSYWATNDTKFVKGEPQWVEINLLNNYSVNKVVLGARQNALGFPYDFDIEVFYDGEWKKAHSVTGFNANEKADYTAYEFTFKGVIGNKVRVSSANFRKVGSSNSMVLSEVAVYGDKVSGNYVLPNENMITSGVGINASSSMEDYDYYMAHLIDTSLTTAWSTIPSAEMTPQTVEVDMKCEVQLSEIQLKPSYLGYGFPIDFTISVYENGKWVDVYTAKDYKQPNDEAIQRFQFDKKNASKFRITATKLPMQAGLYVWKMNEIIAYPLHTGDEFDSGAIDIADSTKKKDAAEVISLNKTNKLTVEISWWKIAVGAALAVIAVAGCVVMLILFKKKKK